MPGGRNPVWSRLSDPVPCDRCQGPLCVSQPDESRPHTLLGVCVRDGCGGWSVLHYAPGDQGWSHQPYARVPCPIDPPCPPPPATDRAPDPAASPRRPRAPRR